jgi:uncharacterized membrane protein YcaP (DUF421 family)
LVLSWLSPVVKPILIYIGALVMVRLVGKRALGDLSLFDFVVMAGIGDVIILVGLENRVTLGQGLFFLGILGGMEVLISLLVFRYPRLARLIEGSPTMLIRSGYVIKDNLRRENISVNDLRQELRKQGVTGIHRVEKAFLESNGEVSVILRDSILPKEKELQLQLAEIRHELQALRRLLERGE